MAASFNIVLIVVLSSLCSVLNPRTVERAELAVIWKVVSSPSNVSTSIYLVEDRQTSLGKDNEVGVGCPLKVASIFVWGGRKRVLFEGIAVSYCEGDRIALATDVFEICEIHFDPDNPDDAAFVKLRRVL